MPAASDVPPALAGRSALLAPRLARRNVTDPWESRRGRGRMLCDQQSSVQLCLRCVIGLARGGSE
jgi:hypothetical protein